MQVSVSQREIWDFMKSRADQLSDLLQPQNCVPNSMINGPLQRLNDLAKLYDYTRSQAERGPDFYKNREPRTMTIELDQGEVYTLMQAAAKDLVAQLESRPYRCDTGTAIKRLNELQAVMPPYVPPSND